MVWGLILSSQNTESFQWCLINRIIRGFIVIIKTSVPNDEVFYKRNSDKKGYKPGAVIWWKANIGATWWQLHSCLHVLSDKTVFKYGEHSLEIHNQGHLNNGDHNPYSSAEDEDNAE